MEVDDGVAAGMRRMGAGQDEIDAARAERQPPERPKVDFEVHEDCWQSWQFFLQVQRLWVFVPISSGMRVTAQRWSLAWTQVRAMVMLRRLPPRQWNELVDDLLVIERAVLRAEAEQKGN